MSRNRYERRQSNAPAYQILEQRRLLAGLAGWESASALAIDGLAIQTSASIDYTPESDLVTRLANPVPAHHQVDLLRELLAMRQTDSMLLIGSSEDRHGFTHLKYQQNHRGIEVLGGTTTVHLRENQIVSISGEFFDISTAELKIEISEKQALDNALTFVGMNGIPGQKVVTQHDGHGSDFTHAMASTGDLIYLADQDLSATLTYRFDIGSADLHDRQYVYIDAESGDVAQVHDRIHHADVPADGTSLYNGTVEFTGDSYTGGYRLRQVSDGVETYDLNNGTNYGSASDISSLSTSFTASDVQTGVQAHFGAEQTLQYFMDEHGRDSFDDAGSVLRSYVSYSTNYANAFWNGSVMTYGDGNATWNPLVSLDIVGHEVSHGVTEYSAGLIYAYESGALNESFSDIFGEAIENFATGSNDWLMGEEIGVNAGNALRSMSDPPAKGDPDTYLGIHWHTSSADNGGVHTNSGVQNKWFYLLSVGEMGINDHGQSYDVTGIGIDAAEAIAYRNLTVYLTSGSQYFDAREGSIQSAIDLFGEHSQQHISTMDAWDAVGVGGSYIGASLNPVVLSGSSIFRGHVSDQIPGAVVDTISLDLDSGQSLSIAVAGSSGLVPAIEIRDPNNDLIADAAAIQSKIVVQNLDISVPGTYQILVAGDADTTGNYDLELFLNASVEWERIDGAENNSRNSAQSIDDASMVVGSNASIDRLAVVGVLDFDGTALIGDDFESGSLDGTWTVSSSDADGRIEVVDHVAANGSSHSLLMDTSTSGVYNLNEAIWAVDLTDVTDAQLTFYQAEWADETDVLPASYSGSANGDGVSISADGTNWTTILTDTDQIPGVWERVSIDLDSAAADAGIPLNANFQIKFQQYDNFPYDSDGRAYDEISIVVPEPAVDWYAFELAAGQSASLAGSTEQLSATLQVDLYDADGNHLVTGANNAGNDSAIPQFLNTGAAATHYAVVSGIDSGDYSLVITRGADFDLEPNDTTPQDISGQGGVFGYVRSTSSSVADPDAYGAGTIIDNLFPGTELSNNVDQGSIYAASAVFGAPTGYLVFAPGETAASGFREGESELRADFSEPKSFVSIDVGSDDSSDAAWLRAYDSLDNLIGQAISGNVSSGNFETISLSRPESDIAYVIAAGLGTDITPLDNLISETVDPNEDLFTVSASANDRIGFHAYLPGQGPYEFHNPLDDASGSKLRLELRDPDGNLVEMDHESVSHIAEQTGDYELRVSTVQGNGEYLIENHYDYAPSDISLSSDVVAENTDTANSPVVIGQLSGTDIDSETLTFRLINGSGDVDNDAFEIDDKTLMIRQGINVDFESQPQYSVRVEVSDGVLTYEKQLQINVENQIEIASIEIGDGQTVSSQRSLIRQLVVTFDELVEFGDVPFSLIQRSDPGGVTGNPVEISLAGSEVEGATVATLTFLDTTRSGSANALLDGNYELTINPEQVTRIGSTTELASEIVFGDDQLDGFFALFGDFNGDRNVNITDTAKFRPGLGSSLGEPNFQSAFDFNNDGEIGIIDRVPFRSNRGSSLTFQ